MSWADGDDGDLVDLDGSMEDERDVCECEMCGRLRPCELVHGLDGCDLCTYG